MNFIALYKQFLPKYALVKQQYTVKLWSQIKNLGKPHNRYILTDVGGVGITYGLDEDEEDDSPNEIFRLSEKLYERRWAEFNLTGVAFELISSWEFFGA